MVPKYDDLDLLRPLWVDSLVLRSFKVSVQGRPVTELQYGHLLA